MYCIAAVGGDPRAFTDFLALSELLHTGRLIVDDVQDNSTVRRRGKTGHLMYGMPTAINAGTAAYFIIEPLLKETSLPEQSFLRIYQLYFICLRAAHTGQGLDIHGLHQMIPACFETGDFHKLWDGISS
jgi:geranylgeranyl pyrophosphate synthase